MKRLAVLTTAILIAGLTGCASQHTARTSSVTVTPPVHPINELRSVAVEVRDELRLLAKTADAVNTPALTPEQHAQRSFQATFVPKGFDKNATFMFTGNASKAAEALAKTAGYQFKVIGKRMPNEPWVSININNQPLNDALRELGVQTGTAMRIEIHDQLMVLVYKN